MALYAIGDVHGCAITLDRLLDRLALTTNDTLVLVGDYVDRGPDSPGVLDRLLQLEADGAAQCGPRCRFLRGNHDQMMLDAVDGVPGAADLWHANGGLDTLTAYEDQGEPTPSPLHIDFIRRTESVAEEEDFVFVHAGLDPRRSVAENLAHPNPSVFLWSRAHLGADLSRWERPVVCGHTPQHTPINQPQLLCIDTGAVYPHRPGLGILTAVQLPARTFEQVAFCG